ncbi:hypothetical protein SAMN04488127_0824 [Bhargavaea ginsengi]|uniref:Uncharacterized protein n=1 Tax=Bhargavaea ginsengi TaxID=426757 RepID=A0A1H6UNG6_9BACL|nr:hypothetical protein [Bhargavaea ginsengi]SEI93266.1 hypothetical protein SAMN04488127_0824 [Bhargavaea ginsengi]
MIKETIRDALIAAAVILVLKSITKILNNPSYFSEMFAEGAGVAVGALLMSYVAIFIFLFILMFSVKKFSKPRRTAR